MRYKIYFEFFNKRMVTEVEAYSQSDAADKVRRRVNILKVEQISENSDRGVEELMKIFKIK